MISYLAIKHIHMTSAFVSGSFFLLRGMWMMMESTLLQRRWVRIAPHIIDTVLLTSALTLAYWSGQYPFVQGWLTAKLLALLLYIVLGAIALNYGKTMTVRVTAFIAALTVFAYILRVAFTRQVF